MTPDFWGAIIGIGSILILCLIYKYSEILGDGNVKGEPKMSDKPDHLEMMKQGCVNDRVRIVFWDPWAEQFIAVTPEFLLEHGAPYNGEVKEYCIYNSTHIANA